MRYKTWENKILHVLKHKLNFWDLFFSRVPLVEQELFTLPKHLGSPPVFSGVRVTRSLVLYVCFVDRCVSFCPFSFGHCFVCISSIYGFWYPFNIFNLCSIIIGQCQMWCNRYKCMCWENIDIQDFLDKCEGMTCNSFLFVWIDM